MDNKLGKLQDKIMKSKNFQKTESQFGVQYVFDDFYIDTKIVGTEAEVMFKGVCVMNIQKHSIMNTINEKQKKIEDLFFDCGGM